MSFSQSKELCRIVFENTSDSIFVANEYGLLVDVSQQLCEMLGYTIDEMLSLSVRDIVLNRNTNTPCIILKSSTILITSRHTMLYSIKKGHYWR